MGWQFPPYAVLQAGSLLALLALAGVGYRKRESIVARRFAHLALALSGWVLFSIPELLRTDLGGKVLANKLGFTFVPLTILALFLFVLEYTGHSRYLTRRWLAALSVEPLLAIGATWLGGYRGFMYADVGVRTATVEVLGTTLGPYRLLETTFGPGLLAHLAYSYLLVVIAAYLLVQLALNSQYVYQKQATSIVAAGLVPFGANLAVLLGLNPLPGLGLTEFGFVVTAVLLGWAVLSPEVLDLVPIARQKVVEEMHEGVLVVDLDDRIVDLNPRAASMLGIDNRELIGAHVQDVLPGEYDLFERFRETRQASEEIAVPGENGTRHFEIRISPLTDHRGQRTGRLVIAHEITDRKQYEQQLERQNEQLDKFASVVSHDLRNPLTVAKTLVDVAEDTNDPDDFEQIRDSLDRIEEIVDDVLELARDGQSVTDLEPTDLATAVRDAWENVDTDGATLTVTVDREVSADRSRLLQVFENVFRNAVEHGGATVTVEVGPLPDGRGFYITDDGPGIPDDVRDDLFEYGVSGADGTGFGLAIVRSIVEAHGWDIAVADVTDGSGGTRFEVTGLPPA